MPIIGLISQYTISWFDEIVCLQFMNPGRGYLSCTCWSSTILVWEIMEPVHYQVIISMVNVVCHPNHKWFYKYGNSFISRPINRPQNTTTDGCPQSLADVSSAGSFFRPDFLVLIRMFSSEWASRFIWLYFIAFRQCSDTRTDDPVQCSAVYSIRFFFFHDSFLVLSFTQ